MTAMVVVVVIVMSIVFHPCGASWLTRAARTPCLPRGHVTKSEKSFAKPKRVLTTGQKRRGWADVSPITLIACARSSSWLNYPQSVRFASRSFETVYTGTPREANVWKCKRKMRKKQQYRWSNYLFEQTKITSPSVCRVLFLLEIEQFSLSSNIRERARVGTNPRVLLLFLFSLDFSTNIFVATPRSLLDSRVPSPPEASALDFSVSKYLPLIR